MVLPVGRTHIGLVRDQNEDCFAIREGLDVFLIADGIGGHAFGEIASHLAVETFLDGYQTHMDLDILTRIRKAFKGANDAVHQAQVGHEPTLVMGTTLTAACLDGDDLYIGHIGDSRAYISRFPDEIQQMTEDHTFYRELAKHDPKTFERLTTDTLNQQRDYLAKAVGPEKDITPQILRVALLPGDRVLLVTDGVYRYFSDDDLRRILVREKSPADVCLALEEGALEAGGKDNLTSLVYFHERR